MNIKKRVKELMGMGVQNPYQVIRLFLGKKEEELSFLAEKAQSVREEISGVLENLSDISEKGEKIKNTFEVI